MGTSDHPPRAAELPNTMGYLQTPAIKVVVGAELKDEFIFHQGLICARSEFFKRALSGPWQESEAKRIELPEDSAKLFALYQHLVYYNTLPLKDLSIDELMDIRLGQPDSEDAPPPGPPKESLESLNLNVRYKVLSLLYVLCEKLVDPKSQQVILDTMTAASEEMVDNHSQYPENVCIRIIYGGTVANDKARNLLVKFYIEHGSEKWIPDAGKVPKDFLFDLSRGLLGGRESPQEVEDLLSRKDNEIAKLEKKIARMTGSTQVTGRR